MIDVIKFIADALLISVFIVSCIVGISKFGKITAERTTERFNLISITLSEDVEGNFVLGTGSISQDKYFVAYKENKDGSKEYYKMSVHKTKIYDTLDEGSSAYAEVDTNGLGLILEVRLFVPQNTITKEINLQPGMSEE